MSTDGVQAYESNSQRKKHLAREFNERREKEIAGKVELATARAEYKASPEGMRETSRARSRALMLMALPLVMSAGTDYRGKP